MAEVYGDLSVEAAPEPSADGLTDKYSDVAVGLAPAPSVDGLIDTYSDTSVGLAPSPSASGLRSRMAAPTLLRVGIESDMMANALIYSLTPEDIPNFGSYDGWLYYGTVGNGGRYSTSASSVYGVPPVGRVLFTYCWGPATNSGAQKTFTGLNIGQTYYVSADIMLYNENGGEPVKIGDGTTSGASVVPEMNAWKTAYFTFTADTTSRTIYIYSSPADADTSFFINNVLITAGGRHKSLPRSSGLFPATSTSGTYINAYVLPVPRSSGFIVPATYVVIFPRGRNKRLPDMNDLAVAPLAFSSTQVMGWLSSNPKQAIHIDTPTKSSTGLRAVSTNTLPRVMTNVNTFNVSPAKVSLQVLAVTKYLPMSDTYTSTVIMTSTLSAMMSALKIMRSSFYVPPAPEVPDPEDVNPPAWGGMTIRALHGIVVDMDTPTITNGNPHS